MKGINTQNCKTQDFTAICVKQNVPQLKTMLNEFMTSGYRRIILREIARKVSRRNNSLGKNRKAYFTNH